MTRDRDALDEALLARETRPGAASAPTPAPAAPPSGAAPAPTPASPRAPAPAPRQALQPQVLPARSETASALVPAAGPRPGRFLRWIQRVTGLVPAPPPASPALQERVDALATRLAAHEELTVKRLEEAEGRTLHLLEKRLALLEDELSASLQEIASREAREQTAPLRRRLVWVALGAAAAALLAVAALVAAAGQWP
jgi:hypothetical protein